MGGAAFRPTGCAFSAQIHESSPLDLASEEPERLPCLQRLLDLGADVNAADKHGGCLGDRRAGWCSLCAGPGASADAWESAVGPRRPLDG